MRILGQDWRGVLVGIGLGVMAGPALVEKQLLMPNHKAWAFLLGLVIFAVGGGFSHHVRRRETAATTHHG